MAQMNDLPFAQQLRRIGSLPQDPSHKGRMLMSTSSVTLTTNHPQPKVWTFSKDGVIWVRDGRTGEVLAEIQSRGRFPRCAIEIEEFKEVWVGHSDGLVRAFQSEPPFSFVDDVEPGNSASGGVFALSRPQPDEDGILFPNGSTPVFVGFGDNLIHCIDVDTKQLVHKLQGHTHGVKSMVCVREYLLSGGEDGMVLAWNAADKETSGTRPVNELLALEKKHEVTALAVSRTQAPENELLWAGTSKGQIKVISLASSAVMKTYHALSAPIIQITCIENVVYVSSYGAAALRFDGTTTDVIPCPVDGISPVVNNNNGIGGGEVAPRSEPPPAPHGGRHNSHQNPSGGIDWIEHIAQTNVSVHWALGGSAREFSAFREESFDRLDPDSVVTKRKQHMEGMIRKIRQDILKEQERLDLRVNPPVDKDLTVAVNRSKVLQQQIVHTVKSHNQRVARKDEQKTARDIFVAWWIRTIAGKVSRFEKRASWLNTKNAALLVRPYWIRLEIMARAAIVRKKKVAKAVALAQKNAAPLLQKYFSHWSDWRVKHGALSRIFSSTEGAMLKMMKPYFKRWRIYRWRQMKLKRQKSYVSVIHRQTARGTTHAYYARWKEWLDKRRSENARSAFIATIAGKSDGILRRIYYGKLFRARKILKEKRNAMTARSLFLGGFSSVLQRTYYFQWLKLLQRRKAARLKRNSTFLLGRTTEQGIRRAYYYAWKQSAMIRLASGNTKAKGAASGFVSLIAKDGLLREYYNKWRRLADENGASKRKFRAIEVLLQGSASGARRLAWTKWRNFTQIQRTNRSNANIKGTFLRGFTIGLQAAYFRKLMNFAAEKHRIKQRAKLGETMGMFSTTMVRSKYFQKWIKTVTVKKQIFYSMALMSQEPDDCQRRYYRKWLAFLASKTCTAKAKAVHFRDVTQAEQSKLEKKLDDITRQISISKWELQNLVSERSEAESRLRGASSAAAMREEELRDRMRKNELKEQKLIQGNEDIYRYREALRRSKERPPVKMAAKWLQDWKELEKSVRILRGDLSDDRVVIRKRELDARLDDLARRSVQAHQILTEDMQVLELAQAPPKIVSQEEEEGEEVNDMNYVIAEELQVDSEAAAAGEAVVG